MMRLGLFITIICLAFGLGSLASAQSSSGVVNSHQNPFENLEAMTGRVLIIIDEHKDGYPANEDAYFEALNTLMTGFVDFDFVAKKVMGRYAKSSSKEQRVRFETAFRQGLVETYGRGLMSYGNEKIVLINKQALADIEQRCLQRNLSHKDWICDERRMGLTAGGDALYMHCLPADIGDEVTPGVMAKHTVNVAREANWKLYVIMALLAGAKLRDVNERLDKLEK